MLFRCNKMHGPLLGLLLLELHGHYTVGKVTGLCKQLQLFFRYLNHICQDKHTAHLFQSITFGTQ
jgi:hypothetical protein